MNVAASLTDLRRSTARFNPVVFILASLAAAFALVSIVAIPQYLSNQARWEHPLTGGRDRAACRKRCRWRSAPSVARPCQLQRRTLSRALEPLVRFHSANPNIFYLYTMVDRGGVAHFVLDTYRRITPSALQPQAKGVGLYGAFQHPQGI